jgi:hypothetical protein
MEEYKLFDELLKKCKSLRDFSDDREKMMFEILRMNLESDGKIYWLKSVAVDIERILSFVKRLTNERQSHLNLK